MRANGKSAVIWRHLCQECLSPFFALFVFFVAKAAVVAVPTIASCVVIAVSSWFALVATAPTNRIRDDQLLSFHQ